MTGFIDFTTTKASLYSSRCEWPAKPRTLAPHCVIVFRVTFLNMRHAAPVRQSTDTSLNHFLCLVDFSESSKSTAIVMNLRKLEHEAIRWCILLSHFLSIFGKPRTSMYLRETRRKRNARNNAKKYVNYRTTWVK